MHPRSQLSGSQLRTYERIFQHPMSHNLGWHDVYGMFSQLGTVETEPNGNTKVTRNGQFITLPPHRTKDVSEDHEVMVLRHFLEQTEIPEFKAPELEGHWLVVIDHHEARLFNSGVPGSEAAKMLTNEPHYFRHAAHSREFAEGEEKPDPNTFFTPLANALKGARKVLVFGNGTGMSSEMDQFVGWLKKHRPELSRRVVGSVVVNENHLSDGQLLEKARVFFAGLPDAHT